MPSRAKSRPTGTSDTGALYELLERLSRRPERLPDLILEAKKSYRQPFRNWV
jgi:hypothetical protein